MSASQATNVLTDWPLLAPVEAIRRWEQELLYEKWSSLWAQSPVADLYHALTCIVKLRLNCYSTAAYQHRIHRAPSPNCFSWNLPETVEHLLRFCPSHTTLRRQIWPLGVPPLKQLLFGSLEELNSTTDFLSLLPH